VDAISGQALADIRLLAKSEPMSSDLTCQIFEATTGPDGSFSFEGLCGSDTYNVEPSMKFMLLDGIEQITGGVQATTTVETKVWRAPGAGVYILDGEAMKKQSTLADVESKNVLDSEELAWFPTTLPSKLNKVEPGQFLMISGKRNVEKLHFLPLIESGVRVFGTSAEKDEDEAWTYIGIRFESDTEFERVQATPAADKVLEVKQGDRQVHYVPGDALPAGQYALWETEGRRTYMLEFSG